MVEAGRSCCAKGLVWGLGTESGLSSLANRVGRKGLRAGQLPEGAWMATLSRYRSCRSSTDPLFCTSHKEQPSIVSYMHKDQREKPAVPIPAAGIRWP